VADSDAAVESEEAALEAEVEQARAAAEGDEVEEDGGATLASEVTPADGSPGDDADKRS
jgi:hypothetical protein